MNSEIQEIVDKKLSKFLEHKEVDKDGFVIIKTNQIDMVAYCAAIEAYYLGMEHARKKEMVES